MYNFILGCFAVMLLLLAIYLAIWFVRRKFISQPKNAGLNEAIPLDEYARLRDSGAMSAEEYDRIRRIALGLRAEAGQERNDAPNKASGAGKPADESGPEKPGGCQANPDNQDQSKVKDSQNESFK